MTTGDVTGATTLFCCPYAGNQIALYDGASAWNVRSSAQFSLALGTLTSGKPYDVFCYDNATVPTLEFLVWTNDTTRATALTYQDGVLVKTGATTRRYLGTFYTTSTTATEDSAANRYLFNQYHRAFRSLVSATETTDTWNYSTNTWRQANANAANQFNYMAGDLAVGLDARVMGSCLNSAINGRFVSVGVGVDSTSVNSAQLMGQQVINSSNLQLSGFYTGFPGVGRHFIAWLEIGAGADTQTWSGDDGLPTKIQYGITGTVWM